MHPARYPIGSAVEFNRRCRAGIRPIDQAKGNARRISAGSGRTILYRSRVSRSGGATAPLAIGSALCAEDGQGERKEKQKSEKVSHGHQCKAGKQEVGTSTLR